MRITLIAETIFIVLPVIQNASSSVTRPSDKLRKGSSARNAAIVGGLLGTTLAGSTYGAERPENGLDQVAQAVSCIEDHSGPCGPLSTATLVSQRNQDAFVQDKPIDWPQITIYVPMRVNEALIMRSLKNFIHVQSLLDSLDDLREVKVADSHDVFRTVSDDLTNEVSRPLFSRLSEATWNVMEGLVRIRLEAELKGRRDALFLVDKTIDVFKAGVSNLQSLRSSSDQSDSIGLELLELLEAEFSQCISDLNNANSDSSVAARPDFVLGAFDRWFREKGIDVPRRISGSLYDSEVLRDMAPFLRLGASLPLEQFWEFWDTTRFYAEYAMDDITESLFTVQSMKSRNVKVLVEGESLCLLDEIERIQLDTLAALKTLFMKDTFQSHLKIFVPLEQILKKQLASLQLLQSSIIGVPENPKHQGLFSFLGGSRTPNAEVKILLDLILRSQRMTGLVVVESPIDEVSLKQTKKLMDM